MLNHQNDPLKYADENIDWSDYNSVLREVNRKPDALKYAVESLRSNHKIVLAAVRSYGYELEHAHETCKKDFDIVLAAVSTHGNALQFADESLRNNVDIVYAAATQTQEAIQYIGESASDDEQFLSSLLNRGIKFEFIRPIMSSRIRQEYGNDEDTLRNLTLYIKGAKRD
jgi:hypothetical protein